MAKDQWWWKEGMKSALASDARSSSYAHLPNSYLQTNRCSKSRRCVKPCLQNPNSDKESGDTNSGPDICIPAIYVQLWPFIWTCQSKQANKQTNKPADTKYLYRMIFRAGKISWSNLDISYVVSRFEHGTCPHGPRGWIFIFKRCWISKEEVLISKLPVYWSAVNFSVLF